MLTKPFEESAKLVSSNLALKCQITNNNDIWIEHDSVAFVIEKKNILSIRGAQEVLLFLGNFVGLKFTGQNSKFQLDSGRVILRVDKPHQDGDRYYFRLGSIDIEINRSSKIVKMWARNIGFKPGEFMWFIPNEPKPPELFSSPSLK